MRKLKKILKLFKNLNSDCCNPNDEYINVNASTNSVIPTCDYMTKITGGLPSLDSDYVHSKNCFCECPGSLVPPASIDETTTIKSPVEEPNVKHVANKVEHFNKKLVKGTTHNKLKGKKCNKLKISIIVAIFVGICVVTVLLILKYVLPPYFLNNGTFKIS
ncbi:protein ORF-J [Elephant endotheliotropic herpesvirus 5B]|nr:protein ORF-J [Elephant endotheliotropic herpesvirus 5B]